MKSTLNSPIEVGVRALMLLSEAFPSKLDLNRLVLLDYGLLHSADLGGPTSLYPPLPMRAGEFGVKRRSIEGGLELLVRAGLARIDIDSGGIQFSATERAPGFVALLVAEYAVSLHERAAWVIHYYGTLSESAMREAMQGIIARWTQEFEIRKDPEESATEHE